jgi:Recombination endonuclease VII
MSPHQQSSRPSAEVRALGCHVIQRIITWPARNRVGFSRTELSAPSATVPPMRRGDPGPTAWPAAWHHFTHQRLHPSERDRLGHPYCHVQQHTMTVADVLDLASTAGPMAALEEWQEGDCALCGGEVPLRWTVADHCHGGGWVRGLLCMSCNALDAHDAQGNHLADPHQALALLRYREHPPAAMLGLRIQYRDVIGWKSICAARHEQKMAEISAMIADYVHA